MSALQHHLFIYGTLRRGGRAHHFMKDADLHAKGSISGKLVHIDQYPGLILCDAERVKGEVYLVNDNLLADLDRYEGCFESPPHYLRQEIDVLLENGDLVPAETYVFQDPKPHHQSIKSGDWIEWINSL